MLPDKHITHIEVLKMSKRNTHQTQFSRSTSLLTTTAIGLAMPMMAHAHHAMDGATPTTFFEGLLSGIAHPVIGLDHLAFLLVVTLLSASLRGAARYLLPAAFVLATVAGTLYHLSAVDLPMTETVIALSVLLGGLTVLLKRSLPVLLMGAALGLIGVFHGYAYGESIVGAEQTPLLSYLFGFAIIQYLLIAGGVNLLGALAERSQHLQTQALRFGGILTAATGAVFLGMNLS
jgi:urease accessory protein